MRVVEVEHVRGASPRPLDAFSRFRLEDVDDLAEVVAVLDGVRRDGTRAFVTLDELEQCLYTSGHAREQEGVELPHELEPDLTEEEWGDPAHLRRYDEVRLAHVVSRLDDPDRALRWDAVAGDPDDREVEDDEVAALALVAANAEPSLLLDGTVYVQQPPVARDDLMIASLPNGYFAGDFDVFTNHAVIRRLEQVHGYRFLGLGAAWLGFDRTTAPTPAQATAVVTDLQHLYGHRGPAWTGLDQVLAAMSTLFVGYAQDFAATVLD